MQWAEDPEIDPERYAIIWQRDAEGNVVREARLEFQVSASDLTRRMQRGARHR